MYADTSVRSHGGLCSQHPLWDRNEPRSVLQGPRTSSQLDGRVLPPHPALGCFRGFGSSRLWVCVCVCLTGPAGCPEVLGGQGHPGRVRSGRCAGRALEREAAGAPRRAACRRARVLRTVLRPLVGDWVLGSPPLLSGGCPPAGNGEWGGFRTHGPRLVQRSADRWAAGTGKVVSAFGVA